VSRAILAKRGKNEHFLFGKNMAKYWNCVNIYL
jgi:hypothetical protein